MEKISKLECHWKGIEESLRYIEEREVWISTRGLERSDKMREMQMDGKGREELAGEAWNFWQKRSPGLARSGRDRANYRDAQSDDYDRDAERFNQVEENLMTGRKNLLSGNVENVDFKKMTVRKTENVDSDEDKVETCEEDQEGDVRRAEYISDNVAGVARTGTM